MDRFYYCHWGPICVCVRENRKDVFINYDEVNFDLWDEINISACLWLIPKGGYYYCKSITMHTYMCSINHLGEHLPIIYTWSLMFNKSSYFSWIAHWAMVVDDTCTCGMWFCQVIDMLWHNKDVWDLRIFEPILWWYSNVWD